MKIVGISGAVIGSKTKTAVEYVLDEIKKNYPDVEVELIDLSEKDIQFADGRDYRDYSEGDTTAVAETIMSADGLIVGTPTYQGSISGALKNIFDLMPESAFLDKSVGIIATAGSSKHYLVVEQQLKPVLSYMKARIVPKYVFIEEKQYDRQTIVDDDVLFRLKRLSDDIIYESKSVEEIQKQKDAVFGF